jgi:hypothetical protein
MLLLFIITVFEVCVASPDMTPLFFGRKIFLPLARARYIGENDQSAVRGFLKEEQEEQEQK